MFDAATTARQMEDRLQAAGTPERAEGEKRYLKSSLMHLGATLPQMHAEAGGAAREVASHGDLIALVEALWARPVHDLRSCAAFVLDAKVAVLEPSDLALLERLIRESKTWALVDVLSGDVLSKLLVLRPEMGSELDAWAVDPDFWVRRSALLSQRAPLRSGASFDRFGRWADAMLDEKEFFIRKAIGWVLRETGRRRPDEVCAWLLPRAARASGVTMREAVKHLPAEDARRLLAARERG